MSSENANGAWSASVPRRLNCEDEQVQVVSPWVERPYRR